MRKRYGDPDRICPCGKRATIEAGICAACDSRLGHERFLRMEGHESASGRVFGAEFAPDPHTTTLAVNGATIKRPVTPEQMILDLKQCGKIPTPRERSRAAVLKSIERAGERGIAEIAEKPGKFEATINYHTMGGDVVYTTLRGLTKSERDYALSVSATRTGTREVVWPSQVYADERARERTAEIRAEMDADRQDIDGVSEKNVGSLTIASPACA